MGFEICKISVKVDLDGNPKYFSLACSRQRKHISSGKTKLKLRPSMRIEYKAKINVVITNDSSFVISKVLLEHNHALSPRSSRHFACHRRLDMSSKMALEINKQDGIRTSKNSTSMVIKVGGYDKVPFNERDCRNNLSKSRESMLGFGDAQALCDYFVRMHKGNPNFYHGVDYDDECRIQNIFWVDARSRAAYSSFSDAISFESTYLTKKYSMPFVPFVGINHHGQSILLGCGLLSNENIETYVWLFGAWLDCMLGKQPEVIVTNQCQSIQAAISIIFPASQHRLCLWHIMKKIPKKFSSFKRCKEFKRILKSIVYDSVTIYEFEENGRSMFLEFDLQHNDWLSSLYADRRCWIPIFVKENFWVGMSTTQRSESMNAYFDDYVNHKTTLKQFVEQYDIALRRKIKNEDKADFSSKNTSIPLLTNFMFEKKFHNLYTNNIFCKFQDEIKGMMFCNVSKVLEEYEITDRVVQMRDVSDFCKRKDGSLRKVIHTFYFDEAELTVSCSCYLFEFFGIICKHCLKVYVDNNVVIPHCYIVDRWRKDIKRKHNFVRNCYKDIENVEENNQYNILYSLFCFAAEIGVK